MHVRRFIYLFELPFKLDYSNYNEDDSNDRDNFNDEISMMIEIMMIIIVKC